MPPNNQWEALSPSPISSCQLFRYLSTSLPLSHTHTHARKRTWAIPSMTEREGGALSQFQVKFYKASIKSLIYNTIFCPFATWGQLTTSWGCKNIQTCHVRLVNGKAKNRRNKHRLVPSLVHIVHCSLSFCTSNWYIWLCCGVNFRDWRIQGQL